MNNNIKDFDIEKYKDKVLYENNKKTLYTVPYSPYCEKCFSTDSDYHCKDCVSVDYRIKLINKINFMLTCSHKDEIDRRNYILSKMNHDSLCLKYREANKLQWTWNYDFYTMNTPIVDIENIKHKIIFWAVQYKRK